MKLIKEIKNAFKIARKIKQVTEYLDSVHLTKDIKDDILIIKEALKRLSNKIPVVKELMDIIF